MTLIFNESHPGPATHALIIGVDSSGVGEADARAIIESRIQNLEIKRSQLGTLGSQDDQLFRQLKELARVGATTPFSAVASANLIADWLVSEFRNPEAPLGTVELLASKSHWPHVDGDKIEAPHLGRVHDTVLRWYNLLDRDRGNIGFFYFAGPAVRNNLLLTEWESGRADFLDFDNVWSSLLTNASRQLCFLDICPELPMTSLKAHGPLVMEATKRSSGPRGLFIHRMPVGPADWEPGTPTCLSKALAGALDVNQAPAIDLAELNRRLPERVTALMQAAGLGGKSLERVPAGNFNFHYPRMSRPVQKGRPPVAGSAPKSPLPQAQAPVQDSAPKPVAKTQDVQQPPRRAEVEGVSPAPVPPASASAPPASPRWTAMREVDGPPPGRVEPSVQTARASQTDGSASPPRAVTAGKKPASGPESEQEVAGEPASERQPPETPPENRPEPDRPASLESIAARMAKLTARQQQCLDMVHSGLSTVRIAKRLGVDGRNVKENLAAAVRTLGAADQREAARLFYEYAFATWPGEAEPGAASHTRTGAEAAPEEQVEAESAGPEPPSPAPDAARPAPEPNTHFVGDDPEVERDDLGRGPLAVALARRLHRIWCRSNGVKVPGGEEVEAGAEDRAAFVLHLDAPWGGGKTSFANFLARVLNPFPAGCKRPAHFLAERAGGTEAVGTIFIDDPPAPGRGAGADAAPDPAAAWPEDARRPWIVVPFNAWQAEHCAPPWWVFYQAIRKGCFNAVWAEGRRASAPGQTAPSPPPSLARRIWTWAGLWGREIGWRLRNPKIMALLGTAAIVGTLILVLALSGVIFSGGRPFNASDAFGAILIGVGGISGLWGLGALLTESVAPGTDAVAERRSLGGGDPFDRFRRHFSRTMAAVKRPVMVIVDDLDRCRPDFVVDLIRGIQTLLRSPRVVFVILGDRDWIERAFEAHHDAMKKVNVGAEQTFGARFVEKAIQMSFILPEMPETRQDGYVRRVLLGPGAEASGAATVPPPPPDLSQQLRADYRETVASAETAEDRKQAEQQLRDKYQAEFQAAAQAEAATAEAAGEPPATPDPETAGAQADKLLGEERAMLAAVDERMGQALLHRLEPLARAFPANPRQIKRIVNAITMYTCVAYLQMEMDETDERGVELAIWVILMTEWPATWRLLAGCPDLLTAITADKAADVKKALRAIDATLLPGSAEATVEEIMRIRADPRLRALIEGDAATGAPALTLESVREFRSLTPLYAGKRKLAAGAEAARGEGRAGTA